MTTIHDTKSYSQSRIIKRTKEICDEFDARVNTVGISFARLEIAKVLAETEANLKEALEGLRNDRSK